MYTRGLGSSIQDLISSTASQYGVPPSIALSVAQRESGFNQSAVGSSGEIGVFQLMPGTAAQLGVNPSVLEQNVQGGITYLAQLYRQFGNWTLALEAYNAGPGNVQRGTVPNASVQYAQAVLSASGNGLPAGISADATTGLETSTPGYLSDSFTLDDSGGGLGMKLALGALAVGVIWWLA
jgi:hypothetical protein